MNLSWRSIINRVLPEAVVAETKLFTERRQQQRVPSQISVKLRWEDGDYLQETAGVAENVSQSGFSILTAEALEPGRTVWVVGRSLTGRKGIVCYCLAAEGGYSLGVRAIDRERRRVDRQPVEGYGRLRFGDFRGHTTNAEARVTNISDGGMQMSIQVPAPNETYVRLKGETLECEGTVRYCRKEGGAYLLGVQFIRDPSLATAFSSEDL